VEPVTATALDAVRDCELARGGGFAVARVVNPRAVDVLAREALRLMPSAQPSEVYRSPEDEDGPGRGNPARHYETADSGPALQRLYEATGIRRVLQRATGLDWEPSGPAGCYLYYREAGHYMGVHRDIEICELALITCVYESGAPPRGPSGALQLWPGRGDEALTQIRRDREAGRVAVHLRPGDSVLLLGGLIPHAVAPVAPGHVRITAPLCFVAR
jgi:hypothetical protein